MDIKEGSQNGALKGSESESLPGNFADLNNNQIEASGNDWFAEDEDDNSTTLADWNIKVPIPDNSTSILDGSTGEFYIYPMGQEGIPYVIIMPFDYSYGGDAFLQTF